MNCDCCEFCFCFFNMVKSNLKWFNIRQQHNKTWKKNMGYEYFRKALYISGHLLCQGNYCSIMRKKRLHVVTMLTWDVSVDVWSLLLLCSPQLLLTEAHGVSSTKYHLSYVILIRALMMSRWHFLRKQRAALEEKWNILDFNERFCLWAVRRMVYADYKFYHIISRSFSENVIYALCSAIEIGQIGFTFSLLN